MLKKVVAAVPLYVGEVGPDTGTDMMETDECRSRSVRPGGFSDRTLDWLDEHDASYTPWAWNAWSGDCFALISSYRGTPTPIWGEEVRARLARNAQ